MTDTLEQRPLHADGLIDSKMKGSELCKPWALNPTSPAAIFVKRIFFSFFFYLAINRMRCSHGETIWALKVPSRLCIAHPYLVKVILSFLGYLEHKEGIRLGLRTLVHEMQGQGQVTRANTSQCDIKLIVLSLSIRLSIIAFMIGARYGSA